MIQYYVEQHHIGIVVQCMSAYTCIHFNYNNGTIWYSILMMWHYKVRINISIALYDIIMSKYCMIM